MYQNLIAVTCNFCKRRIFLENLSSNLVIQCQKCGHRSIIKKTSSDVPVSQWEAFFKGMAYVAVGATAVTVGYKFFQALTDEDFGDGEFPRWVRHEIKQKHKKSYGCYCLGCNMRVRDKDLEVDHIVAFRNGGRTSRANAQILCRSCNAQKGARNSVFDYIRGRC